MGARKLREFYVDNIDSVITVSELGRGFLIMKDGECISCSSDDSKKALQRLEDAYKTANKIIVIEWYDLRSFKNILQKCK